jgi:hypothetical protein
LTKGIIPYLGRRVDLSSVMEGHIVEIEVRRISLYWYWDRRLYGLLQGGLAQSSG